MQTSYAHPRSWQHYITHVGNLLATFFLSILYFCALITGFCMSLLSFLVLGIPFLVLYIVMWWQIARMERQRIITMLQIDIQPMAESFPEQATWIQRFQLHMSRPVTWKSLLYLCCIFPFGVFSFCITTTILSLALTLSLIFAILSFLIGPIFYLAYSLQDKPSQQWHIRDFVQNSFTGYGVLFWLLDIIVLLSQLWGQFGRLMLGMSDQQVRLAQANAIARQERERAEKAERSRQELIINVSHELRTPVASIRGHIESLLHSQETQNLPPDTLRNYLEIVQRETLRLGTLVDDLLSVARDEQDKLRVIMTTVDVREVIEEVYQTLMPLARRERQITLIRELPPRQTLIEADKQRLLQVILNLVRNAITYTPDGGIVALSSNRTSQGYIELMVSDTGIGIPPEDQKRIFERFYRTDASRARTTGGFGLGLAIALDFVKAMGGTMTVESTVGEGSCFHVFLKEAERMTPVSPVQPLSQQIV